MFPCVCVCVCVCVCGCVGVCGGGVCVCVRNTFYLITFVVFEYYHLMAECLSTL